ncbi:MAG TPA: hypothetical protein VIN61_09760 [Gammaproteobacteria bacterium]
MTRGIVCLLGLALGAAAGVGVLYLNPLTEPRPPTFAEADRTFSYRFPESDALLFTHEGDGRLPVLPRGAEKLWENTITGAALLAVALHDEGGKAAVATRLSRPSPRTDFLLEGALLSDDWLITVPGEGSLFVRAENNLWPVVKDGVVPVWYLKRPWRGPTEYRPTEGPHPAGVAVVRGASGRFAGIEGTAVERYELERFGASGPEALTGELRLRLPQSLTVAEQQ